MMFGIHLTTVHSFLEIIKVINTVIMTALGIFYLNQIFFLVMSVFLPKKKFSPQKTAFAFMDFTSIFCTNSSGSKPEKSEKSGE